MSHFAKINENNTVVDVVVCDNSMPNEGYDWLIENFGGRWVKTSYNATIRNKYAAIGDIFDESLDAFLPPKPFESWQIDEESMQWEAPTPYPTDGLTYSWNEAELAWQVVDFSDTPSEITE